MAFYDEYINSATGLTVVSAQEFVDAAIGSTFERVDGTIFTKNSQGYFDITGNRGEDNITRIEANEVDIANLQSSLSSNVATLQANISSNDVDITNLQSSVSSNDVDIATLQSRVTSNDVDIANLQSSVSSNVANLQANITSNDVDIANLQAGVDSIDSSNFTTLSTLRILNSSGSTLKTIHGSGV